MPAYLFVPDFLLAFSLQKKLSDQKKRHCVIDHFDNGWFPFSHEHPVVTEHAIYSGSFMFSGFTLGIRH